MYISVSSQRRVIMTTTAQTLADIEAQLLKPHGTFYRCTWVLGEASGRGSWFDDPTIPVAAARGRAGHSVETTTDLGAMSPSEAASK